MSDISYATVMLVTLGWDKLKTNAMFQEKGAEIVFLRMFELEPATRSLFLFNGQEDIKTSPNFKRHADTVLDMIDLAVSFLGPDLDPLKEDLMDLGKRHLSYGVETEFLPVMERALMYCMEEILEDDFTKEDRNAWQVVFNFMISNMVKGMK